MTEQMHYATFGRNRRRPRRNNDRPRQVTKPSASTAAPPSKQQGRRPDSRDKRQDRRMTNSRRSDPDGAYCLSREEHSRDVKEKSRNSSSRGRNDSRPRNDSRGKPQGTPSNDKCRQSSNKAPPQQRKSCTDARPTRSSHRSPSPHRSTKPRSSSSRPSRPSSRNEFNDKRLRSHSTKSTRSAKSAKSEAPTLTSELGGFDLKLSKATPTASRKPTTKMYLMNKISGLSILGACKKDTRSRPPPMRNAPSRTTRSRSEPRRKYQLEEESCTYMSESDSSYSSSSESEFISDYEEFSSSSSSSDSSDESLKSMNESEEVEIYHAMMEESSFVEDEFVSDDDDEISGAEELHLDEEDTRSPSVSTRSKALIQTLEAENAALRASVVTLRSDWEIIVNRMARLQDGDELSRDEVTDRSPNLDAIRELRDHALESLKQKRSQEMIERNKRETDLKSCIECVEELLCENERLYDNIVKLSQEREEILQELNSLKKQAVHSLEESHHSGLILADEEIAKSHEEYIDDIASLLSEARKDPNGKNGDIGNEIVQLISRVMSQRTEVESTRYCSDEEEDVEAAAKEASMMENSALVVRRESSRQSTRRSSRGSDDSRHTRQMIVDDETEYDTPSCRSSTYSPRRRSSRTSSRGSDDSRHMIVDDETDYEASSRMSSRRRSSGYSESSRRRSSYYSDSSRQYSDDEYMSDSESEDEMHHDPVIHASMNSLFAGDGPSFSTQDGESNSPDLDVINEEYSDSESEYSSDGEEESPLMSPKKKSWYNAVRTVANRIRNKDRRRGRQRSPRNYIPDEEDCTTRDSSRRSSDNTILSDIEATHYPENISRCSPSTTTSTSRSSSSRSRSSSKSKRVSRQLSSSFTSIKEDHEMSFDEAITNQFPKDEEKQEAEVESLGHEASEQHDYNESNFSIGTPSAENEDLGTSYATKSPGNVSVDIPMVKPRRTVSTCASISHGDSEFDTSFADSCATSGSESTKERKGISITVVSRSSKFLTLPSSRSHTYMTFFTASLLKDQIDKVLYEQYHESMREIIGSMSSVDTELASGAKKKKKNKKYQGDLNELSERHGYGIYKSKNGNEYRGEWQHDKREGLGVVKIGNGDVFEGQFENNMKNGLGVYHYIDGECDLSMYKDDQRIGKSLRYTTDRKRAFLLSEDLTSKEVSIADAAMEAKAMGVIIQL